VTWGDLFERTRSVETTEAAVRETLARRRDSGAGRLDGVGTEGGDRDRGDDPPDGAVPTRIVADADVLAADLLLGDPARDALDAVRTHAWLDLVASEALLSDARAVIDGIAGEVDPDLADDWLRRVETERVTVGHPAGDHPGLASAYRSGATHLLTLDEDLTTARTGLSVRPHLAVSVRRPEAFAAVFDAGALYAAEVGDDYSGGDRDPRN
jgi:hypothetical protein